MAKTVHFDYVDFQRIEELWIANGRSSTNDWLQALETEIVPHLSTSGSYNVTNAEDLSQWLGQLITHLLDNADRIKGSDS